MNNQYWQIFHNTNHDRKAAFKEVLDLFKTKPINILEIGCTRDLNERAIFGDGYSSFEWVHYINLYGGSLKIVDISQDSINNCKTMLGELPEGLDVEFVVDDGINHIDDIYDLVFLDGSDDPLAMTAQYEKVNRKKSVIFCDDWNGKGKDLEQKHKDFKLIQCNHVHQMAYYL